MTQDSPLPVAAFQRLGHSATSMISKTERRVFRASSVSVSLSLGDMFPTPPFPGLALFGTVNSSGLSLSTTSFRRRPSRDWHSSGLSTLRDCHSRRHLSDAALFGIGAHVAVENLSFENRSRGCCVGIVSHTFLAIGAESVDSMLSPSAQPCVSRSPPPAFYVHALRSCAFLLMGSAELLGGAVPFALPGGRGERQPDQHRRAGGAAEGLPCRGKGDAASGLELR